jgi:hypothetical protein
MKLVATALAGIERPETGTLFLPLCPYLLLHLLCFPPLLLLLALVRLAFSWRIDRIGFCLLRLLLFIACLASTLFRDPLRAVRISAIFCCCIECECRGGRFKVGAQTQVKRPSQGLTLLCARTGVCASRSCRRLTAHSSIYLPSASPPSWDGSATVKRAAVTQVWDGSRPAEDKGGQQHKKTTRREEQSRMQSEGKARYLRAQLLHSSTTTRHKGVSQDPCNPLLCSHTGRTCPW